jgi:hypothetical protein
MILRILSWFFLSLNRYIVFIVDLVGAIMDVQLTCGGRALGPAKPSVCFVLSVVKNSWSQYSSCPRQIKVWRLFAGVLKGFARAHRLGNLYR